MEFDLDVMGFVELQKEIGRLDCCSNSRDYLYMKEKIDQYFLGPKRGEIPIFGSIISLLKSHPSNHGKIYFEGDKPMSLYEHTLDFLFGLINGTGLQVDVGGDILHSQAIIIAGLYHDSGKSVSRYKHEERAGKYIDQDLSFYPEENTSLLKDLITHNSMFFNFGKSVEEIYEFSLDQIKNLSIKYSIHENVVFRMLCSMFIADSTTMRRVYQMNKDYADSTFDNMGRLTINDMDELIARFKKDPYA